MRTIPVNIRALKDAKRFNNGEYDLDTILGAQSFLTIEYYRLTQELSNTSIAPERKSYLENRFNKLICSMRWLEKVKDREITQ